MILLAPLAKEAGGYAWCQTKAEPRQSAQVFRDRQDPDWQAILRAIQVAHTEMQQMQRFGMPGFRPNQHYTRELKRYGVLPAEIDPAKDPIDMYQADRAYWRSFWYQPTVATTAVSTH